MMLYPEPTSSWRFVGLILLVLSFLAQAPVLAQDKKNKVTVNLTPARLPLFSYASVPRSPTVSSHKGRLLISSRKMGETILELDPNSFMWDGYSPSWGQTRMMGQRIPVTLHLVQGLPLGKKGAAKVYEIKAKDSSRTGRLGYLGERPRLVVGNAGYPLRLLVLNDKGQVQRVIPLENQGKNAVPAMGVVKNTFSLESVFLGTDIEGVPQISIQGSLNTRTAKLILDRNAKTLDAYGDPDISTLMMPMPIEVKLVEKTDIGKARETVRVFDLEGLPSTIPQKFRLVTARTVSGNNRLIVLNADKTGADSESTKTTRVIPLEIARPAGNP